MEAICRLSMVKALPTDEELSKVKCSDGALFLRLLENKNLDDEIQFADLQTHSCNCLGRPCSPLTAARSIRSHSSSEPSTRCSGRRSQIGYAADRMKDVLYWLKVKLRRIDYVRIETCARFLDTVVLFCDGYRTLQNTRYTIVVGRTVTT